MIKKKIELINKHIHERKNCQIKDYSHFNSLSLKLCSKGKFINIYLNIQS